MLPHKTRANLVNYYYLSKKTTLQQTSALQQIGSRERENEETDSIPGDPSADYSSGRKTRNCINCHMWIPQLQSTLKGPMCLTCFAYWRFTNVVFYPDAIIVALKLELLLSARWKLSVRFWFLGSHGKMPTVSKRYCSKYTRPTYKLPSGLRLNPNELLMIREASYTKTAMETINHLCNSVTSTRRVTQTNESLLESMKSSFDPDYFLNEIPKWLASYDRYFEPSGKLH
ncbi:unnamed protein product [Soboliphyme baturini]|uniref:SANT domain-containing protein n=1 Tax=Soboliphyme baturini TaxID=241478 RepID=A0A183J594_9BILA|nr:unnamed protein product [Soboliphyme baturini]